jgi:hypothetical protein
MKKSAITRQGLDNVGFIGRENETTLDDMSRQAATPAATLSAV